MINNLYKNLVRFYPLTKGRSRLFHFALQQVDGVVLGRGDRGVRLMLDLSNLVDSLTFLGAYENENYTLLREESIRIKAKAFIDVGANIGLFTICALKTMDVSRVYAFEPDPRNYAQLMGNVFLNDVAGRGIFRQAAVGASHGSAKLHLARDRHSTEFGQKRNTGTSALGFNQSCHRPGDEVEVEVVALDDVIGTAGDSVLIKMDVEGHEIFALQGMKNLLTKNKCSLLVEVWPANVPAVDELMISLGYTGKRVQKARDDFYYTNVIDPLPADPRGSDVAAGMPSFGLA